MTADGTEREVDTIIFGTGFHVTDLPVAEHIRGRDGRTLAERWEGSPQAHRGTTVAGYPEPLLPARAEHRASATTRSSLMAEAQAALHRCRRSRQMRPRGVGAIEARPDAQREWNAAIQRRMEGTVWTEGGCASWYIDRNGLNTTLWPDFSFRFVRALRRFDPASYIALPPASPAVGRRERVAVAA